MASDVIGQRFAGLFQAMDTNGDGLLEAADFEAVAETMGRRCGLELGSDDYGVLRNRILGTWEAVREVGDIDGDGKVTRDEWVESLTSLGGTPEGLQRAAIASAEAQILAMDQDGDGQLDRKEYCAMMGAWGASDEALDTQFDYLDQDHDGYVSREEMLAGVREFWYDEDAGTPQIF